METTLEPLCTSYFKYVSIEFGAGAVALQLSRKVLNFIKPINVEFVVL